jgi:hypothetical protein
MVCFMEKPLKTDDDWGYPHFKKHPCSYITSVTIELYNVILLL